MNSLKSAGAEAPLVPADLPQQVARALQEDIGQGDVSAQLIPAERLARAHVISREPAILCGSAWFDEVFHQLEPRIGVHWHFAEGTPIAAGARLCDLSGPARALLTGERTALNFLQLLSGTATITHRYSEAVAGTSCRVLDTRKTIPGLRTAQKYAVRCGGGSNHRIGLYDMVLIKENHIAAAGSILAAVTAARRQSPPVRVEVETESLAQVREALEARADVIMLDNFDIERVREAVTLVRAHDHAAQLEVSGGVNLHSLRAIAQTGVDYVSVGALTKHLTAIDLSMRLQLSA